MSLKKFSQLLLADALVAAIPERKLLKIKQKSWPLLLAISLASSSYAWAEPICTVGPSFPEWLGAPKGSTIRRVDNLNVLPFSPSYTKLQSGAPRYMRLCLSGNARTNHAKILLSYSDGYGFETGIHPGDCIDLNIAGVDWKPVDVWGSPIKTFDHVMTTSGGPHCPPEQSHNYYYLGGWSWQEGDAFPPDLKRPVRFRNGEFTKTIFQSETPLKANVCVPIGTRIYIGTPHNVLGKNIVTTTPCVTVAGYSAIIDSYEPFFGTYQILTGQPNRFSHLPNHKP